MLFFDSCNMSPIIDTNDVTSRDSVTGLIGPEAAFDLLHDPTFTTLDFLRIPG
jgi:hypothetical protein